MANSIRLLNSASYGSQFDFVIKIKSDSGRKMVQVICADLDEGLHIFNEDTSEHVTESVYKNGEVGQPFGRVKFIA
jgi:hypothetical protein